MATDRAKQISADLQELAGMIADFLEKRAGDPIAFVLVLSVDETAQYISNASREDGAGIIESLLERWKANRADIPAHYNPDLKR